MPTIDWMAIIKSILEAILTNCPEANSSSIRNLGPLGQLRFRRAVRVGSGLSPKEWRQYGDEIMAEAEQQRQAASDTDLQSLIDEAKAG